MAINKVVLGGDTLIDLSGDTVQASDVVTGKTFHLASGASAQGSFTPVCNYSTSEKAVGTFVNGKTVYQKTISFSSGSFGWYQQYSARYSTSALASNVEHILYAEIVGISNGRACGGPAEIFQEDDGTWQVTTFISVDSLRYITIRYTKTTG